MKGPFVIGIIFLFIGIAIQPVIIADDSIKSDNTELVEITVEVYEVNRVQQYTVMLTPEKAEELELLINNTKTVLDTVDNLDETETIFKDTVLSLNELGLIPNSMSVTEAQRLVTGEEQNPRIVKFFERYYSKNQKSLENNENTLCLIIGETINTIFIGPFAVFFGLNGVLLIVMHIKFWRWLKENNPDLWSWFSETFGNFGIRYLELRMLLWIAFGAVMNFLPLKIGAYIHYGWFSAVYYEWGWEFEDIPAEGWVNTYGLSGNKSWSGNFYGDVFGFTGIKIITGFLDFFYLGAALKISMDSNPSS